MPARDVVSWNSMVAGLAKAGDMDRVFAPFESMPEKNPASWNGLICGYVCCGDVIQARKLFDQIPARNNVSWITMNSAETGPAFQVALPPLSCIYFLNDKTKNVVRASITGFATLVVGWIVRSILVPVFPTTILPPTWTLELLTSLVPAASRRLPSPPSPLRNFRSEGQSGSEVSGRAGEVETIVVSP